MASVPARTGAAGLPAVWLRHNCRCADCLDPVTGQRLRDVSDLPAGHRGAELYLAHLAQKERLAAAAVGGQLGSLGLSGGVGFSAGIGR